MPWGLLGFALGLLLDRLHLETGGAWVLNTPAMGL